jgi:hypothetical protein
MGLTKGILNAVGIARAGAGTCGEGLPESGCGCAPANGLLREPYAVTEPLIQEHDSRTIVKCFPSVSSRNLPMLPGLGRGALFPGIDPDTQSQGSAGIRACQLSNSRMPASGEVGAHMHRSCLFFPEMTVI